MNTELTTRNIYSIDHQGLWPAPAFEDPEDRNTYEGAKHHEY